MFIMTIIISFGIICVLAGSGQFDHWNSRYKIKVLKPLKVPVVKFALIS